MNYYIIVYKNTHDAMEADKILSENEFEFRIMPTPTSIGQSCGICTRLNNSEEINIIIKEKLLNYKGIYQKQEQEFIKISG